VAQEQSVSTASKILVALEQKAILEKQVLTCGEGTAELQVQITLLNQKIQLMQEILDLQKEKIEMYKDKEEIYKQTIDAKDKLFEQQLKAMTPSFMDNVKDTFTKMGAGAAVLGLIIWIL
jgi:hypothetical protein